MTDWQPYREPLRTTLARTVGLAVIAGGIAALAAGSMRRWPSMALLMLWPAYGGHVIELLFLNRVRSRLPANAALYRLARIALWFVGGAALAVGMRVTAQALAVRPHLVWLTWAVAGAGFVAIELLVHARLHLLGRASFYNALG